MKTYQLIALLVICGAEMFGGEFEFKNLGFDEATTGSLRPDRGEFGPAAELLPAWTFRFGDSIPTIIGYNASSQTSLFSNYGSVWGREFRPTVVQGEFAFYMLTLNGALGTPSISQAGLIPSGVNYLAFTFAGYSPVVTFQGQTLRRVAPELLSSADGKLHDVFFDIAGYAGGYGELRFSLDFRGPGGAGDLFLDNIRFTNIIPEPGVASILGLGAALVALRQWRFRRGL